MKKHSSHPSSNDKMNPSEPVGYDGDVDFVEDIDSKSDSSDENATAIAADGLIPFEAEDTSESVASTPYRAIHFSDTETPEPEPIPLPLHAFDGIQSIADDPDFQVVPQARSMAQHESNHHVFAQTTGLRQSILLSRLRLLPLWS